MPVSQSPFHPPPSVPAISPMPNPLMLQSKSPKGKSKATEQPAEVNQPEKVVQQSPNLDSQSVPLAQIGHPRSEPISASVMNTDVVEDLPSAMEEPLDYDTYIEINPILAGGGGSDQNAREGGAMSISMTEVGSSTKINSEAPNPSVSNASVADASFRRRVQKKVP